jgi:class 3 adenylate cyclase
VDIPETRYARSGGAHIAYQVVGEGAVDVLFLPHFYQHLELWWESRHRAAFTRRLSEFARVILFDKRGTGLSDRTGGVPPFDVQMDDVGAVLDAADSDRALLWAVGDAAPMILLFAATFPQRVLGLVLTHPFPTVLRKPDMPWLPAEAEFHEQVASVTRAIMDTEAAFLAESAPSLTTVEERREYWRPTRLGTSVGDQLDVAKVIGEVDVRHVLPTIRVPTLVLTNDAHTDRHPTYRYVADRIPAARYLVVPGRDRYFFLSDAQPMLDEVRAFVDECRALRPDEPNRVLATVLFTDIVSSTARASELGDTAWRELLREHHARVRRELARFRGRELDTAGDGFFATFDGPARAIRCACAVVDSVRELGLEIRAGLHAGECELLDDKVTGIAVALGARVAARAEAGEVLVSSTVKDLVAGSGIQFSDRGSAELKGVPGEWRLFAVESS